MSNKQPEKKRHTERQKIKKAKIIQKESHIFYAISIEIFPKCKLIAIFICT